jgi:hypothetical protein
MGNSRNLPHVGWSAADFRPVPHRPTALIARVRGRTVGAAPWARSDSVRWVAKIDADTAGLADQALLIARISARWLGYVAISAGPVEDGSGDARAQPHENLPAGLWVRQRLPLDPRCDRRERCLSASRSRKGGNGRACRSNMSCLSRPMGTTPSHEAHQNVECSVPCPSYRDPLTLKNPSCPFILLGSDFFGCVSTQW